MNSLKDMVFVGINALLQSRRKDMKNLNAPTDPDWFRDFTDEELGWYRYWFEFLKLSDSIKWTTQVRKDFGDISDDLTFEEWWMDHKHLFHKLDDFTLMVMPRDDFIVGDYDGPDGTLGSQPDVVGIVVNMYAKKQDLRDAFENILDQYHKGRVAFTDLEGVGDVYNLAQRPDAAMLEKILAVYLAYESNQSLPENDRKPLWQIEEDVSKTTPLIDKTKGNLWRIDSNDPSHIESRRRSQHTTVRKYVNYAEEILANVVTGKFPVYTTT